MRESCNGLHNEGIIGCQGHLAYSICGRINRKRRNSPFYGSLCELEESLNDEDNQNEENICGESECEETDEASLQLFTIRGEKEKQK